MKMNKHIYAYCFLILLFFSLVTSAQEGPLQKGQIKLNFGLGIGPYLGTSGEKQVVPPLSASAEYAATENITVGGIVGYYASEYRSSYYNYSYRFTHKLIGARLNYYYDIGKKFDAYGGATLGYNIVGFNTTSSSSEYLDDFDVSTSGIFYSLHIGGRYNFSPKLAAFAELGYGFTALNLGLTINMGN